MLPDTWGAKTDTGGGHQWTGRGKASNTGLVTDDVQVPCFYSALLFWHASPYCPITAERQNWFRLTSERQIHVIHPETNRESDPFSTGLWYSQRVKPSFTKGTSHLTSVKYSRAACFYDCRIRSSSFMHHFKHISPIFNLTFWFFYIWSFY